MKTLFITLSMLSIAFISNGQGYFRGGGGAGFGVSQDAFAIPSIEADSTGNYIAQRTIYGSFGQGARFSLAGGYMITPYFGIELELYYMSGFKQEYGNIYGPGGKQYNRKGYTYQMRATPSLVVQAPVGKFQPFARFGVLIPFYGRTVLEESTYFTSNIDEFKTTEVQGRFSLGFESSIGVEYKLNDNLGIYLNATLTTLRIKADRADVVSWERIDNNTGETTDKLSTSSALFSQIDFTDELTPNSNTTTLLSVVGQAEDILVKIDGTLDADKALELPTQTSNFNAMTFSVGVRYSFGKKTE